jgi:hypothetical protein
MKRALAVALAVPALAGCGLSDPYSASTATTSTAAKPQVRTSPVAASVEATRGARAPLTVAHAFLRGYLLYLYGLGEARSISAIAPKLRAQLAAQPMTRDDGASPSHPRLEALRLLAQRGDQAVARAIVTDESGVYFPRELALMRGSGGWVVTAIRASGG